MEYIKGKGIVLNTTDYGASDKIVNIYLFGEGYLTLNIKGCRKPTSKLKNAAIVMSFGEYVITKGKTNIVSGYESIDSFMLNNNKIKRYFAKCILIELLNKYAKHQLKQDDLALQIIKGLSKISYSDDSEEKYLIFTLVKSLQLIGYKNDFTKSHITQRALDKGARFYPGESGLIDCDTQGLQDNIDYLSPRAVKQLAYFSKCDEDDLESIESKKVEVKPILNWIKKYLEYEFDSKFNAIGIYLDA